MTDLPAEVRDRAARAALDSFHKPRHPRYNFETTTEGYRDAWREVVDAVAEVLAEQGDGIVLDRPLHEAHPALVARAWHDITCPEGPDCRERLLHSAAQTLANTGMLARFLERLAELHANRTVDR